MKVKVLLALGFLTLIAVPAALAAGLWPNLPIVGSAAYCAGAGGVAGATCTATTPAGPTVVTGSELVPADTRLASGRNPQTVLLPMAALNALPVSFTTGSSSANNTVVATATQGGVVLIGSAALSPVTLTLPPSPIQGQEFALSATQTIASLTVQAAGSGSVANAPTALTVSTTAAYGYRFKYNSATTTWYRLQ